MSLYPIPENAILSTIPEEELRHVAGGIKLLEFREGHLFYDAGEPVESVAFPLKGVVSILACAGAGVQVEALMVGNEGMVGLPLFLGRKRAPWVARARTAGEAFVMDAATFQTCVSSFPCLTAALRRYTQSVLVSLAQVAICRGAHTIEKRCARWLLTMQDRMYGATFPLTQEFLAKTLGVRRASINTAVSRLHKLGIIRHERGQITILERERLEGSACVCYQLLKAEFLRSWDVRAATD